MTVADLLPLHALGLLDPHEVEAVEAALALDPSLRREVARVADTVHATGAALVPVAPEASHRARLLASLDELADPEMVPRVAALFDVDVDRARALCGWVDDASRWIDLAPGVRIAAVRPGPAQRGQQCGLLRIAAGARFPWHGHLGREVAIVLAGGARMADGRDVVPGDTVIADETIEHDFVADAEGECVFAVRAAGIQLRTR